MQNGSHLVFFGKATDLSLSSHCNNTENSDGGMIGSVCAMHPSSSWLHHRQGLLSSSNARSAPPSLELLRPSFPSSCSFKLLFTLFSLICIVSFPTFYSSFEGYFGVARSGKYFSETKVYGLFPSAYKSNQKTPPFRREAWLESYGEFSKQQTNVSVVEALEADTVLSNVGFCDYNDGKWVIDPTKKATYFADCPFARNSWRCAKNQRPGVDQIVSWRWIPKACSISSIDGRAFLNAMRNRRIGFIGDSLNENFMVALLCTLRAVDKETQRWKRRGAWKGAFFPGFNVTIGYHRAVLLAEYSEWQPKSPEWPMDELGVEKAFRIDVDIPASSWVNVTKFYDVLIFNTGH
ncbi:hypothetical protein O6H91_Y135700 [Diphasiastrum complanatum]|nr:hypothetical protein O6H91_Y135700 [Diphasiastrum complanatum]